MDSVFWLVKDKATGETHVKRAKDDEQIAAFVRRLVLLYDPSPHPLLCVEEPENQLYPKLLYELAEEFGAYASKGGQVFISTHSPDFLNAVELDSVFWLVKDKETGETHVKRAKDDEQIAAFIAEGDKMGYLWKQGFFGGVDPL